MFTSPVWRLLFNQRLMVERETPRSSWTSFLGMPRSIAASVFNLRSFEYAFMGSILIQVRYLRKPLLELRTCEVRRMHLPRTSVNRAFPSYNSSLGNKLPTRTRGLRDERRDTMTDRIANPWGTRMLFGRDVEWPVRVDQFLEEGLSEEEVDRWVQTASILHSNRDALDIAVKDGRMVGVRGRAVDRVNKGRVDPKDLFGWQANASEDRLKRPLVRGQDGELVEASWDEAMDRIVEKSKGLLEEKGPLAFGFYTSGQLFLEEYYTLGVIGEAGLGTPHMDGNTRLCTATAGAALKETFGTDGQPGSYADVDHADAIVLYGHNVAETQAVLWMHMLDRLEGPNPPKLMVVDPRPTLPAQRADVHLAVNNGTNLALMNALLHELIENGWYEEEYVRAHAVGFEALKDTVADCTPEWAASICGVSAEDIRKTARIIGNAERLLSTALQGFYQSHQATAAACLDKPLTPAPRDARQAGVWGPADERPAYRPEYPRDRSRR